MKRSDHHVTSAGIVHDPKIDTPSDQQLKVASDSEKKDEKPAPLLPDGPLADMQVRIQ